MSSPFVSVVTPSYEQAVFLEENLVSVMEQSEHGIEHIVVDGGSTDGSVDLLRQYEDQYDLTWISEPDEGQSDALNKGIERANGEWILWLNSDDYLLGGAIERFHAASERYPDSDLIYGDYVLVDEDGVEIGRKYNSRPSKFVHKYYYQFAGNHSTFFRRGVFQEVGGVDTDLHYVMDTELFWRILQTDLDLQQVPAFFATRRLHEDAKTTGPPSDKRLAEIEQLEWEYPTSNVERVLPKPVLTATAFCLQALYHALDGRPGAIRHMLS